MTEELESMAKRDDDIIYCGCGPKTADNDAVWELTLETEPKFCRDCGETIKTRRSKIEGILVKLELDRIAVVALSDFQDLLEGKDVKYTREYFYGE